MVLGRQRHVGQVQLSVLLDRLQHPQLHQHDFTPDWDFSDRLHASDLDDLLPLPGLRFTLHATREPRYL